MYVVSAEAGINTVNHDFLLMLFYHIFKCNLPQLIYKYVTEQTLRSIFGLSTKHLIYL